MSFSSSVCFASSSCFLCFPDQHTVSGLVTTVSLLLSLPHIIFFFRSFLNESSVPTITFPVDTFTETFKFRYFLFVLRELVG